MPDTLVSFDRLDYRSYYRHFTYTYPTYANNTTRRRGFLRQLAKKVVESERERVMTDIGWCQRCTYPELKDSLQQADNRRVCTACVTNYVACDSCNQLTRSTYRYSTLDDDHMVCQRCVTTKYRYCDTCGSYYRRTNYRLHAHDGNNCCDSPMKKFEIRNNGNTFLKNDKRVTITLPEGEISQEGLNLIASHVRNECYYTDDYIIQRKWINLSSSISKLGNMWQTKEGNYAKRLSRYAYKEYGLKVPPKLMTLVGNVARDHSKAVDFEIATTRRLNMSASSFAHPESCWWQSYHASRCAFKTNGGFAIRTFSGKRVTGRAWVMPMKRDRLGVLRHTFNTKSPDMYMVFNGYGDLSGYGPARILSHMTGMTYRKVEFVCDPMYVNGGSGYLVGPEELVEPFTDGRLSMSIEQHASLFDTESKELVNV